MTNGVPRGVTELFETWQRAFRTLDVKLMHSLWDADFERPVYIAEENPRALCSHEEIAAYLRAIPSVVDHVPHWEELDRSIAVTGHMAAIYGRLRVALKLHGVAKPLDGEVRTTHVLHERDGRWLLIQYHESRQLDLAAIVAAG